MFNIIFGLPFIGEQNDNNNGAVVQRTKMVITIIMVAKSIRNTKVLL